MGGGILSPIFYCIYVDDLVEIPTAMGVGCHLREIFLSILLYADDMALIAPSLKGLQKLLSATEEYCKVWDIMLNAKKSENMSFGKKHNLAPLQLDGKGIDWVVLLCIWAFSVTILEPFDPSCISRSFLVRVVILGHFSTHS